MRVLVTGSAGHLGEALMRTLPQGGHVPVGLDIAAGRWVDVVGSVDDRELIRNAIAGADAVIHTATLHKPHVGTHAREQFVQTNVTGTLVPLEEAVRAGVGAFVFTSSTSVFGRASRPGPDKPAAWITEDVEPQVRNIYGASKQAAEALCELVARDDALPTVVLRTSRFFPEPDDLAQRRDAHDDLSLKVSELLYRRCDLEDVVSAHLLAIQRAPGLGSLRALRDGRDPRSEIARAVGAKGYHDRTVGVYTRR